jgi:CII-binding regulator of phage lambda lysogenization HflD
METQYTNGKKLLNRIREEKSKINRLKKRMKKCKDQITHHEKKITKMISQMSNEDLVLYCDQFDKMNIQP